MVRLMFDYKGQLELLITSYGLLGVLAMSDLEEVDVLDILVNRGDVDLEEFFFKDMPIERMGDYD